MTDSSEEDKIPEKEKVKEKVKLGRPFGPKRLKKKQKTVKITEGQIPSQPLSKVWKATKDGDKVEKKSGGSSSSNPLKTTRRLKRTG